MARFNMNIPGFFLETYKINNGSQSDYVCILVKRLDLEDMTMLTQEWLIHPREAVRVADGRNYKFCNEIEITRVVIGGQKLQQLIQELHSRRRRLLVNNLGLCLASAGPDDQLGRDRTYYPIYELFDWSKYGVAPVANPLQRKSWSAYHRRYFYMKNVWKAKTFSRSERYKNFDSYEYSFWNGDEKSQVIRLNYGNDVFISCKDGPILLWKVDSPVGDIRTVRLMEVIDGFEDKARIEVNGVMLKGVKVVALRDELFGRQVMVNAHGWCLYYTRGERGVYYYYRIFYRFDWNKYGVPTSGNSPLWDRLSSMIDHEPITTQAVLPPSGNKNSNDDSNEAKVKQQKASGGVEKPREIICGRCKRNIKLCACETRLKENERELNEYKLQVKENDKKLNLLEQCLNEKQQELEDTEDKLKKREGEVCVYKLQLEEKERELGVSEKRLKEKGQELLKCKSQLEEKEKELNSNKKLLKEKNQELHDCKLELEDKEKRIAPLQESSRLVGKQVGRVLSPKRRNRKSLCQKDNKDKDLESKLQEKTKELSHYVEKLEEKEKELKNKDKRKL